MVRKKSVRQMAEEFADMDPISDNLWDLRGQVCETMKKKNYLGKDAACSEHQGTIDAIIRRLIYEM